MSRLKYYIGPSMAILMGGLYYIPWIAFEFGEWSQANAHVALGFYTLSFLLLIFAWIPLIICAVIAIIMRRRHNPKWINYFIVTVSILLFYFIVGIGIANCYMMTV